MTSESSEYHSSLSSVPTKCPRCRRDFMAVVLVITVFGVESRIAQKHCDTCCAGWDKRENGDKKNKHRAWHLTQGLATEKTFGCNFANSRADLETPDYEIARQWIPATGANWYIYGNKGRGKTFLARCLLNTAFDLGMIVGELNAVDFTTQYDMNRGKGLKYLRDPQVILIDDIDKAAWTVFSFQQLYGILNYRNERNKKTIITSNTILDDLIDHLKKHIDNHGMISAAFDRMNPVQKVRMIGDSFRKDPTTVVPGSQSEFDEPEDLMT